MCDVLQRAPMKQLRSLHLSANRVSTVGMQRLADVINRGELPDLKTVLLDGNPGDAQVVHDALERRWSAARAAKLSKRWKGLQCFEWPEPQQPHAPAPAPAPALAPAPAPAPTPARAPAPANAASAIRRRTLKTEQ